MKDGFDAAFLGFGLAKSVQSAAERITGLFGATEFLVAARKEVLPSLRGKKVAVIGGGNTAMDAAMAARQGGAKDVYVLYRRSFEEMPAVPRHRNEAMSAGVHFLILTQQLGYLSKGGPLTGVRVCPVQLGPEDASGRQIPVPMTDCAYNLDMDVVIEAIGQEVVQGLDRMIPGVAIRDGLVEVDQDSYQTSRPGVFAGGDLVHGASTVVAAVRDGMKSGQQMDAWMTDGRNQTRKRAAAG
jgi:NADPH-dependent glutamate synthase beta subunit-like oxidoreductase